MNEHAFIKAVHNHLDKHPIYAAKLSVNFINGFPDAYYSTDHKDMWVEYKAIPSGLKTGLSPLQRRWLTHRYSEGRQCWLVILTPKGVVTYQQPPYPDKLPKNYGAYGVPLRDFMRIFAGYLLTEDKQCGGLPVPLP